MSRLNEIGSQRLISSVVQKHLRELADPTVAQQSQRFFKTGKGEYGNRDRKIEECFLLEHYAPMPRTMLRYSIEKFDRQKRQAYLKGDK